MSDNGSMHNPSFKDYLAEDLYDRPKSHLSHTDMGSENEEDGTVKMPRASSKMNDG